MDGNKSRNHVENDRSKEYVTLLPAYALAVEDINTEQRAQLERLNTRLRQIEAEIMIEVLPQIKILENRKNNSDDWLQDYECECTLLFTAREDDPDFDKDNENAIVVLTEYLKGKMRQDFGMADDTNHNEFQHCPEHPMQDEFHCWLYHCLYDHTHIGWANILRIGDVWIDIQFRLQHRNCLI